MSVRETYKEYTEAPDEHLFEGFSPEEAAEVGVQTPDTYDIHVSSGKQVGSLSECGGHGLRAVLGHDEHQALVETLGAVRCANCNRPGCSGCGTS